MDHEMWVADIETGAAYQVTDFAQRIARPGGAASLGNTLLFRAYEEPFGTELWSSNGSPAGTALLKDIDPRPPQGASSRPLFLTPVSEGVFFFASEPDAGYQPWISDGTEAGTRRLGSIIRPLGSSGSMYNYSRPIPHAGGALFLVAQWSEDLVELWRLGADGDLARLSAFADDRFTSTLDFTLVPLATGAAILRRRRGPEPDELWVTDGSAAGTRWVRNLEFDREIGRPTGGLDGRAFFAAEDTLDGTGVELWVTDGSGPGTYRLADLEPGPDSSAPNRLTTVGDLLFFVTWAGSQKADLWASDGTGLGTRRVADSAFLGGDSTRGPTGLTALGDRLFFFYSPLQIFGRSQLWISDGTASATRRVAEAPRSSSAPVAVNDRLWWLAFSQQSSGRRELWVSDGTAAGTRSLAGLIPSHLRQIHRFGDSLLVSAQGPLAAELWQTDGTLPGTRKLAAVPDTFSAYAEITPVGSQALLSGPYPFAGTELLAVEPTPAEPCSPDGKTLCLLDDRFAVTVRWYDHRSARYGVGHPVPFPGSSRTGSFWFFHPSNLELIVKALDGTSVNGWFWTFYGALTDLEYWVEVTDTASGRVHEYHNPAGNLYGRGDTAAFPATPEAIGLIARAAVPTVSAPSLTSGPCGGVPGALCLLDNRFRVEVAWRDHRSGDSGIGTAIPWTGKSGYFWFFSGDNVELMVKMVDGRAVNGKFWVFYGALSDVEYTVTVTDTETGERSTYTNPPGEICGRGDTAAFNS